MSSPERILDVATRRFAQHGFDGTSLQHIADEVGIRKPTLLYHYASKEALRHAVLDGVFEHFRQILPGLLARDPAKPGRFWFDAIADELTRFFLREPDRARILLRHSLDDPNDMRLRLVENLRPWMLLVAEQIRVGIAEGSIHADTDPESYVLHVVTLTIAAISGLDVVTATLAPTEDRRPEARERYVAELARIARRALFTEPPAPSRFGETP